MKQVSTGLLWGIFMLIIACSSTDKSEIAVLIDTFYSTRENYANVNKSLLSAELVALIDSAQQKEKNSAEKVSKSNYPTDKPLLIEGDIFTGLYEGSTSHEILEIRIRDSTAVVKVRFYNNIGENISWTDDIHVLKKGKWKIDNVVYGHENPAILGSLKEVLRSFNQTEL